ncbi:TlpA disulfide reductase family protein [Ancylomarina sp. 16SWW S1-10-2]|uniref:TlpA disulfide reductase family protein n=1 Tax=Ancylomarina sp. 16SWW S1-10-2 TaxID=2499681 RepID=UPI0012AEA622|nr:TlpA disulfide reductase family protein [Ancylomarina sp. 16SWW S1-10-2]MRT94710.1 AhpC/TSA family protein [Ancylomarina sp. 16SWW S1-10-2]
MKKILITLMAMATLFSCSQIKDNCIIKGQFSSGDGEVVVLPYQKVQSKQEYDSLSFNAKIKDGKFELQLDAEKVSRQIRIKMGKEYISYTVFSEPGVINLKVKDGKLIGSGSTLNDEYHQLLSELNYEAYNKLKYNKNPNSEEKKTIDNYISKLWNLSKEYPKSIPLTQLFYEKYWGADVKTLDKIINSFSEEIRESYYLKEMLIRKENMERVAIGKQAPIFSLTSVNGEEIALDRYKGKYLLVDFWASWCGPCRAGIPNLKEIYKDYKSKGLEILSVSTDADEKAWLKAVDQEQMPWSQVRDTKSISNAYNITYIPMIFLIDPNGKIIDKGLHGEAIRNRVEELISKK